MSRESREERKARLAEATWRIILDQGVGAVSVRTVAAEAEMAVGSLRHLFPSQAELLEYSAELMIERASARVSATRPGHDSVGYVMEVIGHLLPLTPDSRREFEINIALIAETPANPGLARIRDRTHAELTDLFTRLATLLRREGDASERSRRDGRRLLALVDGLGLHLLHQSVGDDTAWATGIVREEVLRIERHGPR